MLGVKGAYPGFSDDALDGFRHLAADLAGPVRPMLTCDRDEFASIVEDAAGCRAASSGREPNILTS